MTFNPLDFRPRKSVPICCGETFVGPIICLLWQCSTLHIMVDSSPREMEIRELEIFWPLLHPGFGAIAFCESYGDMLLDLLYVLRVVVFGVLLDATLLRADAGSLRFGYKKCPGGKYYARNEQV